MRSKLLALVLTALTVVTAIAITAPASARAPGSTQVTFRYNGAAFDGMVKSNKESKCANGRKVTVFKVKNGKDQKVGSDTATANGDGYQWFVVDKTARGKYYAKAGNVNGCKPDKTKTITVN